MWVAAATWLLPLGLCLRPTVGFTALGTNVAATSGSSSCRRLVVKASAVQDDSSCASSRLDLLKNMGKVACAGAGKPTKRVQVETRTLWLRFGFIPLCSRRLRQIFCHLIIGHQKLGVMMWQCRAVPNSQQHRYTTTNFVQQYYRHYST